MKEQDTTVLVLTGAELAYIGVALNLLIQNPLFSRMLTEKGDGSLKNLHDKIIDEATELGVIPPF